MGAFFLSKHQLHSALHDPVDVVDQPLWSSSTLSLSGVRATPDARNGDTGAMIIAPLPLSPPPVRLCTEKDATWDSARLLGFPDATDRRKPAEILVP